jgi:hypothetical protein
VIFLASDGPRLQPNGSVFKDSEFTPLNENPRIRRHAFCKVQLETQPA